MDRSLSSEVRVVKGSRSRVSQETDGEGPVLLHSPQDRSAPGAVSSGCSGIAGVACRCVVWFWCLVMRCPWVSVPSPVVVIGCVGEWVVLTNSRGGAKQYLLALPSPAYLTRRTHTRVRARRFQGCRGGECSWGGEVPVGVRLEEGCFFLDVLMAFVRRSCCPR